MPSNHPNPNDRALLTEAVRQSPSGHALTATQVQQAVDLALADPTYRGTNFQSVANSTAQQVLFQLPFPGQL